MAHREHPQIEPNMTESVQSFIDKVRNDSIEAGQQMAAEILAEARRQAEQIVAEARQREERIAADAEAQAQAEMARGHAELRLAVRDAILSFREALRQAVRGVLEDAVRQRFADRSFLAGLLREIAVVYSQVYPDQTGVISINMSQDMWSDVMAWTTAEVGKEATDALRHSMASACTLSESGFEYTVGHATVEVTPDSVVQALTNLMEPELRAIFEQAIGEHQS